MDQKRKADVRQTPQKRKGEVCHVPIVCTRLCVNHSHPRWDVSKQRGVEGILV